MKLRSVSCLCTLQWFVKKTKWLLMYFWYKWTKEHKRRAWYMFCPHVFNKPRVSSSAVALFHPGLIQVFKHTINKVGIFFIIIIILFQPSFFSFLFLNYSFDITKRMYIIDMACFLFYKRPSWEREREREREK